MALTMVIVIHMHLSSTAYAVTLAKYEVSYNTWIKLAARCKSAKGVSYLYIWELVEFTTVKADPVSSSTVAL